SQLGERQSSQLGERQRSQSGERQRSQSGNRQRSQSGERQRSQSHERVKCQRYKRQKSQQVEIQKKSPRHLTVLSGPNQFIFFPDINGKRVLLLGDVHNPIGRCKQTDCDEQKNSCHIYEIQQWLRDLAQQAPECLDIFLETQYLDLSCENQCGGKPLH